MSDHRYVDTMLDDVLSESAVRLRRSADELESDWRPPRPKRTGWLMAVGALVLGAGSLIVSLERRAETEPPSTVAQQVATPEPQPFSPQPSTSEVDLIESRRLLIEEPGWSVGGVTHDDSGNILEIHFSYDTGVDGETSRPGLLIGFQGRLPAASTYGTPTFPSEILDHEAQATSARPDIYVVTGRLESDVEVTVYVEGLEEPDAKALVQSLRVATEQEWSNATPSTLEQVEENLD